MLYFVVGYLMKMSFSFRVKMEQSEIEISKTKEEVMKNIEELPQLMETFSKAFVSTKNREEMKSDSCVSPSVSSSSCGEAVFQILTLEWDRYPRSLTGLRDALKANAVYYPFTTLSGLLSWLVRKNKIKRGKTDNCYV